ncbi:YraN family protein [Collibacillus ludicampi]|uniref:YraN family protein n=1 Tax=Collibacillus ludicampi TaxID=2771369 RepID=UPI0024948DC9|nr:YraN family protein [Collibacillus ludicampi]
MKVRRKELGRKAEKAAKNYLEQCGFHVEFVNWRCQQGELDLIAWEGNTLVFVEVRSRSTAGQRFGTALEAVDQRKQRQVRHVAAMFLQTLKRPFTSLRFDVIAVEFHEGEHAEITHIRNAF